MEDDADRVKRLARDMAQAIEKKAAAKGMRVKIRVASLEAFIRGLEVTLHKKASN